MLRRPPTPSPPTRWSARPAAVAVAGALASAAGCGSTRVCNPALERCDAHQGGEVFSGEAAPASLRWGCCTAGEPACDAAGAWWFDLWSDGTLSAATWTLIDASSPFLAWSEVHPVGLHSRDPDGWWENRYIELVIADGACTPPAQCADAYAAARVTAFPCRPTDALPWTFRVDVEDRSGEPLTCLSFGAPDLQTEACVPVEEAG